MSRRDRISSLIAEQLAAANSAAGAPSSAPDGAPSPATSSPATLAPAAPGPAEPARRVAAGPVRTMGLTLDRLELERKALVDAAAAGGVVEIDPGLIDASFARDRFAEDENGGVALEALKASIAAHGQEIPILVRAAPGQPGRYQAAYGHRRLRACQALGRPVRAIVRALSDAELVVAQGLENAERVDLSYIEKAVFAAALEDRGFPRPTIMAALSTDKTELSKLISAARGVPPAIIRAVGPAPKAGRRRWLALAELLARPGATARVEALLAEDGFRAADSDARLTRALERAERAPAEAALAAPRRLTITGRDGRPLARVTETDERLTLTVDRTADPAFADFLLGELPELHARFAARDAQTRRRV
jgi:ParB family chromosome partitioning protein